MKNITGRSLDFSSWPPSFQAHNSLYFFFHVPLPSKLFVNDFWAWFHQWSGLFRDKIMEGCNPNAQNIEVYKSCINFQYLCNHFDEYGISLKMPEEDASNRNAEGLMALKIKVVAKVVEHFDMDLSSISPINELTELLVCTVKFCYLFMTSRSLGIFSSTRAEHQ